MGWPWRDGDVCGGAGGDDVSWVGFEGYSGVKSKV